MDNPPVIIQNLSSADYASSPFEIVILPLGSLESHGPHMPFGTDAITAYEIALEVSRRMPKTAVLPPVNYGMSEHYKEFPFTVSLQPETETALIQDILESVFREGIRKVFIMNGHDGNIPSLKIASRQAKVAHPELKIIGLGAWWSTLIPLLPENFFEVWNGLGHGGEGELSMGLALFPDLCHPDRARGVVPNLPGQYRCVLEVLRNYRLRGIGRSDEGDPEERSRHEGCARKCYC